MGHSNNRTFRINLFLESHLTLTEILAFLYQEGPASYRITHHKMNNPLQPQIKNRTLISNPDENKQQRTALTYLMKKS